MCQHFANPLLSWCLLPLQGMWVGRRMGLLLHLHFDSSQLLMPHLSKAPLPHRPSTSYTLALSLVQNKQKCQIKTFCCYFHSVHCTCRAFIVRECIIYNLIISLLLITHHDICSCNGSKILNVRTKKDCLWIYDSKYKIIFTGEFVP